MVGAVSPITDVEIEEEEKEPLKRLLESELEGYAELREEAEKEWEEIETKNPVLDDLAEFIDRRNVWYTVIPEKEEEKE